MKVCILGGTGLVGSSLVKNLKNKYEVYSPTRIELNLLNLYEVSTYFTLNNFDVVINCAADTRSQMIVPNDVCANNVNIFLNLYNNKDKFNLQKTETGFKQPKIIKEPETELEKLDFTLK